MIEVQLNQTGHVDVIASLCSLIGARTYLELGVYDGNCLFAVAERNPGIQAVGVDKNPLNEILPENVQFVLSFTADYLKSLKDEQFDVVFIDANHDANAVMDDLQGVFPHVSDHGLIFLHDTFPIDASWTVPELCGSAYMVPKTMHHLHDIAEYVTLPYHPGLTIIRKRKKQTAWEEHP